MHNITIPNTKQIKPIKPVSMDTELKFQTQRKGRAQSN